VAANQNHGISESNWYKTQQLNVITLPGISSSFWLH